jgi:hypothetical protein
MKLCVRAKQSARRTRKSRLVGQYKGDSFLAACKYANMAEAYVCSPL